MANAQKDLHKQMSKQSNDFDIPVNEGALDVSTEFRDSLSQAIRRSNLSRWEIAARVSEFTGTTMTKDMLDKYTSNNKKYRLPAEHLTALLCVLQDIRPAAVLMRPLNHYIICSSDNDLLRLKELKQQRDDLNVEISKIERTIQ